jgi:hypothetical protein
MAWHSNRKEMFAIQSQIQSIIGSDLLLQTDNKTVVADINNEGGTKSVTLPNLCRQILVFTSRTNITFTAQYFRRNYNCVADHLSRRQLIPEWHLINTATTPLFQRWGVPEVDLFASETAHVIATYVSRDVTDSGALFHDAFSRV